MKSDKPFVTAVLIAFFIFGLIEHYALEEIAALQFIALGCFFGICYLVATK